MARNFDLYWKKKVRDMTVLILITISRRIRDKFPKRSRRTSSRRLDSE